ncbi:hypothetical protein JS533_005960 [Bifidobacterium amazonense]|uniref:Uncharacterized protein n=1 Tax=Bifidobacterium amazonense TaxID=2809027 RepID=A0ABS9VUP0_9BIFI|nr:hypothetical protein [Bifidobacterium amazonense]MCH9275815.1 hypothetical protein [Bifidobacterium amazonense]
MRHAESIDMVNADKVQQAVQAIESRNGLRHQQGVHTWFITQNNPIEQIPECSGMTPEQVVQWAAAHCTRNLSGELRKSRGVGVCYERGDAEHTDHIHIALTFTGRNGGKAETVYRLWPKGDIEVAKGTLDDIHDYLHKQGRFSGKGETIVAPVYDGEPLMANPRKGEKADADPSELSKRDMRWLELVHAVDDGMSEEDIWADPTLSLYAKDFVLPLQRLMSARAAKRPHKRDVTVIWVSSEYSHSAHKVPVEVMESVVRDWMDASGLVWGEWDTTLLAQPHITLDTKAVLLVVPAWDSSKHGIAYRLMSGSPMKVPQGYGRGCWAAWDTVVIVTPDPPIDELADMVSRCVVIPLDASTGRMRELVGSADNRCMPVEEIAEFFDAKAVTTVKAGDAI